MIKNTPLELNKRLSDKYNCNIYFKREDQQIVRSFKIRGAYNKITKTKNLHGIVCASAGNHAQGVAYTSKLMDIQCDIFIPNTTPLQKINRIKHFGGDNLTLHIVGNTFNECLEISLKFSEENNKTFIHPYDDMDVIEGQSKLCYEIYEKLNPDIIICPVGGGGLISGIVKCVRDLNKSTIIHGVEPELMDSMYIAFKNNKPTIINSNDTFVDGASVSKIGNLPYEICKNNVELSSVCNGKLCENILELYHNDGIIVEPAGALSVAGLDNINIKNNMNIVCIISGGNNDLSRYPEYKSLYLSYKNLKHYFIIKFKQKPGELKKFILNVVNEDADIIRFEYIKKSDVESGSVLIGIELLHITLDEIYNRLDKFNFEYKYIDSNDIIHKLLV